MRLKPLVQSFGNGFVRKKVTAVEIGGKGKIGSLAAFELAIEDPDVDFIRTGDQRDRVLIPLDVDGCIVAGRKRAPDIDKRLPQVVARLRVAASWPERLGKLLATMAATACQDQGGEEKRRLARGEANGLALRGNDFEVAKQPDAHELSPDRPLPENSIPSVDLTPI